MMCLNQPNSAAHLGGRHPAHMPELNRSGALRTVEQDGEPDDHLAAAGAMAGCDMHMRWTMLTGRMQDADGKALLPEDRRHAE